MRSTTSCNVINNVHGAQVHGSTYIRRTRRRGVGSIATRRFAQAMKLQSNVWRIPSHHFALAFFLLGTTAALGLARLLLAAFLVFPLDWVTSTSARQWVP